MPPEKLKTHLKTKSNASCSCGDQYCTIGDYDVSNANIKNIINNLANVCRDNFVQGIRAYTHELDNVPEHISPPSWVEKIDEYHADTFIVHKTPTIVVIHYNPTKTLGEGFTKIAILDKSGNPFPQMDPLMGKISEDLGCGKNKGLGTVKVSKHGKIHGMFGRADWNELRPVIDRALDTYRQWRKFPTIADWKLVEKMLDAKSAIRRMRSEEDTKDIQDHIDNLRGKIKDAQEKIVEMEKKRNEIYEAAADGMNLLEENGIDPNAEDEDDELSTMYAPLSIDYDSSTDISVKDWLTATTAGVSSNSDWDDSSYKITAI